MDLMPYIVEDSINQTGIHENNADLMNPVFEKKRKRI